MGEIELEIKKNEKYLGVPIRSRAQIQRQKRIDSDFTKNHEKNTKSKNIIEAKNFFKEKKPLLDKLSNISASPKKKPKDMSLGSGEIFDDNTRQNETVLNQLIETNRE